MKLFDLHCDTIYELYKKGEDFENNTCHISNKAASVFEKYTQMFAVWSVNSLDDDAAFEMYKKIVDNFNCKLKQTLKFDYMLAVEGGKMLGNDISRLYRLKEDNVRYLTLVWGGECGVGGAHNTHTGLSDFGRDVVNECFDLEIIPDVSHASDELFWDAARLFEKAGKPMLATHSNSRAVHNHTRNLTDDMFKFIRDSGGIVGVSLYPHHLCEGNCDADSLVKHIEHYLDMSGEKTVALGCDFDGIEITPIDIKNVSGLEILYKRLQDLGYPQSLIDDIFCNNAANYFEK